MNRRIIRGLAGAGLAVFCTLSLQAELAPGWHLDAGAKKLLAEWSKTPYARKSGKTDFFVRAQLKYGLERADYIHHWYDRPLCQDTTYAADPDPITGRAPWLAPKSWAKIVENVNLGKQTGLAVFTSTSGRESVIPASVRPGCETTILVELISDMSMANCLQRAGQALEMPNSFRINGKVVLTSYPQISDKLIPFYGNLRKELAQRYGDKFLILPYFGLLEGISPSEMRGGITAEIVQRIQERLARALRVVDGISYCSRESIFLRRYEPWLFDEVFIPILRHTYAQEEFREKCLGCGVTPGHENSYRWNYGLDSTGTQMLRGMLDSSVKIGPDFIIGYEWDEVNENTCFRPTVANGFTHQRLLRHYNETANGAAHEALPGDDVTRPNLVLSYRKELMSGEPIEAEVLNIPDGTFKGASFGVTFAWAKPNGEIVKEFPSRTLKADELKSVWFNVNASELVDNPSLLPVLEVTCDGKRWTWSEGFWPLGLHATRTIEYKWVKTPVRELPEGVTGSLQVIGRGEDGGYRVRAQIAGPRKFRSVTILDEADAVACYDGTKDVDGETVRVRLAYQGLGKRSSKADDSFTLKGRVSIKNAPSATLSEGDARENVRDEAGAYVFTGARVSNWVRYYWIELPRAEATNAVIAVDLEAFKREIRVADLMRDEVYAFSGAGGVNLVFSRALTPRGLPAPVMEREVDFTFRLKPGLPNSVVRLEAIDENYRVWRAKPLRFGKKSGERIPLHVYERAQDKAHAITVDSSRLAKTEYVFEPSRGSVVAGNGGRHLWGILGGYVPLVTGFGREESTGGNPPQRWINPTTPGWPKTTPDYVQEEDGSWALAFSGCSYVTLPQQIWPAETGFTLELLVKPAEVTRKQSLLTTGATSSELYIENGRVYARCFLCNKFWRESGRAATIVAEGPAIQAGVWQTVRVTSDQKTLRVDVDGARGEPVEMTGDLFYPLYTVLGIGDNASESVNFEGRMKSLKISAQ